MRRALPSLALLLCLAVAPVFALPAASVDPAAPAPDCAAGLALAPDAALAAILAPPASPDGDQVPLLPAPRFVDTIVDCDTCPSAYRQCFRQCRSYGLCDYSCSAYSPSCELASCLCTPC